MKWISVDDKMPPLDERILIHDIKYDNICISQLVNDSEYGLSWKDEGDEYWHLYTVDYWQPLPIFPKKLKNGLNEAYAYESYISS